MKNNFRYTENFVWHEVNILSKAIKQNYEEIEELKERITELTKKRSGQMSFIEDYPLP